MIPGLGLDSGIEPNPPDAMHGHDTFSYASARGQLVVMLLAALHDLYVNDGWRTVTKHQAIDHVSQKRWFALEDQDMDPYPSQRLATNEPRWHTLIAWARKDSVLDGLVTYEAKDAWGLTRLGREEFERFQRSCQSGSRRVSPCFLWRPQFKLFLNPAHVTGTNDACRPHNLYRDKTFEAFLVGTTGDPLR